MSNVQGEHEQQVDGRAAVRGGAQRDASSLDASAQEQSEGTSLALEVAVSWGDSEVLQVDYLHPPRSYFVGEPTHDSPPPDCVIGAELLGTPRLPVVVSGEDGSVCIVIAPAAAGYVTVGRLQCSIEELIASGHARASSHISGGHVYPLVPGAAAHLVYRGFTFSIRMVAAAKPVGKVRGLAIDYGKQVWTALSFALHGLFLTMMYLMPPGASALSLDLLSADARLATYLLKPPAATVEQTPDWMRDATPDQSGGEGQREQGAEGEMGKTTAPKSNRRYAVRGPADNRQVQLSRDVAKSEAKSAGILGVLNASQGAWNAPTSVYGGESAIGYDPITALGNLMGNQIGDNVGFGGLGLRGTGRAGGGDGSGTIGLGQVATVGHGAGGGASSGYGRGAGRLGGRVAKVPQIRVEQAEVRGSLSKEVIRRVIHSRINEVRFCYEQELSARPDLRGRVAVKFIVAPSGAVQTALVESSTLGAERAETCIAQAVRRWSFPAPDGGGIVVVSYPFLLESGN